MEDPTVLQIHCGSCSLTVNVPASLLAQLLAARRFSCPHCRSSQHVRLEEDVVQGLWREHLGGSASTSYGQPVPHRRRAAMPNGMHHGNHVSNGGRHYDEYQGSETIQTGEPARHGSPNSMNGINPRKRKHRAGAGYGFGDDSDGAWDAHFFSHSRGAGSLAAELDQQAREAAEREDGEEEGADEAADPAATFMEYKPAKLDFGVPHPDPVCETASLASVEPPDISYQLHLDDLVEDGALSALQLESVVYACQRHEAALPDRQRAGFFIGDGAGVGKGRTIAGLILENWRCGRKKHLWLSIGSDLRFDSRRDLDDVGAADIAVQPLNKLPYGSLAAKVPNGVLFLTYSSLISSSEKGLSRLQQILEWCGPGFDGLIVFDECHKAKNLVPDSGGRATKVGEKVLELQRSLPLARVVYCSATGASEPRNLGYMERLGLWGQGNGAFGDFATFLTAVASRGVGALELIAMDLKAQGAYVARTLSFAEAEFEVREEALGAAVTRQYADAAIMWCQLRREFLYAAEQIEEQEAASAGGAPTGRNPRRHMLWRAFWGAHQRFFRYMCMASKVPALVRLAKEAVEAGRCCVIGLQSTGESRTADVIAERGEELDDFVSGPRELLIKLVEDHYPMPTDPYADPAAASGPKARRKPGGGGGGRQRGKAAKAAAEAAAAAKAEDEAAEDALAGAAYSSQQSGFGSPEDLAVLSPQDQMRAIEREHIAARLGESRGRKEQVLKAVAALDLPNNPLDSLIDMLGGPAAVAEMTGRKGRLVRRTDKPGVRWEARNASGCAAGATLDTINVHERTLFMAGTKLIAVISEAASAGISLHADKRAVNQKRRVHLTLELPWSADKAIQQFGRSHRANQAHAPLYRLLFTPLGGERRFAASVARRLESLGALTQGDRRAGPSLQEYNYESVWGRSALKATYKAILEEERDPSARTVPPVLPPACRPRPGGLRPEMSPQIFYGKARAHLLNVGIIRPAPHVSAIDINAFLIHAAGAPADCGKVSDQDKGDIPRFLNRLLGLEPAAQAHVFDLFQATLEATVDAARREGNYDEGIVDIAATSITISGEPRVVRTDRSSGAKTLLYTVMVDRGVPWEAAQGMLQEAASAPAVEATAAAAAPDAGEGPQAAPGQGGTASGASQPGSHDGFYRAKRQGPGGTVHGMLAVQLGDTQPPVFRVHRPATGRAPKLMRLEELHTRYQRMPEEAAKQLWEAAYRGAGREGPSVPGGRLRRICLLGGLVLPVWDVLQAALEQQKFARDRKLSVLRLQTSGEESRRLVGIAIPEGAVDEVLLRLSGTQPDRPISLSSDSDDAREAAPLAHHPQPGGLLSHMQQPAAGGHDTQPGLTQQGWWPLQQQPQQQQPQQQQPGLRLRLQYPTTLDIS